MQPILAESAPHPGRAVAFTFALAIVASLLLIPRHHHATHRGRSGLPRIGKCVTSQGTWYVRGNPPMIYRSVDRAPAGSHHRTEIAIP